MQRPRHSRQFFCRVGLSLHKSDPNSQRGFLYSICIAVGCNVGPEVYQALLFQVGVKRIAGAKFGVAIRGCYDTVKFATYNIVGWTLTQDINKVDSVNVTLSWRLLLPEGCLNLNVRYLTLCNSSPTN